VQYLLTQEEMDARGAKPESVQKFIDAYVAWQERRHMRLMDAIESEWNMEHALARWRASNAQDKEPKWEDFQ
jgi:hypothetical protein